MTSRTYYEDFFATEPEQKPITYTGFVLDNSMLLHYRQPASGQAKTVKPTGAKPEPKPKQHAEAPRVMTRDEFAVENRLAAGSEKSLNPEDPDCPRMQNLHLGRTLQDVREQLKEARDEHLAYKAAVLPLLEQYKGEAAKIDPLEKQLDKFKNDISGYVFQIRRLMPFEQEMPAEKAKNAELTQELVDAKAKIVVLEAGVDPEVEKLKQDTLHFNALIFEQENRLHPMNYRVRSKSISGKASQLAVY
jgi:hypothetical protein